MLRAATLMSLAAVSGAAVAQPAITIEVDDPVLLPGESTTVTLFAGFDRPDWAMAGLQTDFVTSVGSHGWSDPVVLEPMDAPGASPGLPSTTGYDAIIAGQLQFLGAGIFADPMNPATFWQATYTAPADVAAPFDVDLSTMTSRYDVYIDADSSRSESRLAELVEGSGTISVVPAPASIVVLVLGAACVRRRY
ncbi:MAG: hypothetical protein AAFV77_09145 [Planctomycetota bacterium]